MTLNGRGYLLAWCAGDDYNGDFVDASWTPADDERLFERAVLSRFFSEVTHDYPFVGECKTVVSFECSAIVLEQLWRRRRPAAWSAWRRRWLAWYRAEVGDELIKIDPPSVESTGVRTAEYLQAFVKDLHANPSRVLAAIADGSLPTADSVNLVVLRRLDDAGALRPIYRPSVVGLSSLGPGRRLRAAGRQCRPGAQPAVARPAKGIESQPVR